jgi:phenylpropionate dioxygenase-like ring-hydroxylating dioxygenase large terminal subunit
MLKFILLANIASSVIAYASPFHNWHCIDIMKNIDLSKPYAYNVADLPLVSWFDKEPKTTLNICKHMGSKLDYGKVENGCLTCPFHGIRHTDKDVFGQTIIHEDKLWWSYEPKQKLPPSTPFYHNENYSTIMFDMVMDANIKDCIYNVFDINHFAFVHNDIFGNDEEPTDYKYTHKDDKLCISYTYKPNENIAKFKKGLDRFYNYQVLDYPYSSSSVFSLRNSEKIVINVNMLPIAADKTKWIITIKHNFWKSYIDQMKVKILIKYILMQDKEQMAKQARDSMLKHSCIHKVSLKNENHFKELNKMFKSYRYPDTIEVMKLYQKHTNCS